MGDIYFLSHPATAVLMLYVTNRKKKGQAEALQFFSPGDLSLQSMKHGRQRRERKYRGTGTDREV